MNSVNPGVSHYKSGRWPTWLILLVTILTVFNGLPFLAPLFMHLGWETAGRVIYFVYSFMCHQMAQRSFFLFGSGGFQMYNLTALPIQLSGLSEGRRILALRSFIGNPQMGWKVAWSDRMVYMYSSPLLAIILYGFARTRIRVRPISLWIFGLLLLPMAVDGFTHMISDFAGIGQGFRDSNLWLAALTGNVLPAWFYGGDALGSFNSWMRLFSGLALGLGVAGLIIPYLDIAGTDDSLIQSPQSVEQTDNRPYPAGARH
jgi:uncharacterized membrane protein